MNTLHIECSTGVSGDMLLAALLDTGTDIGYLRTELQKLPLEGYSIEERTRSVSGVRVRQVDISDTREQPLRHYTDLTAIIENSSLSSYVQKNALATLRIIGEAEARVHNTTLDDIHFHEIGAVDTIIDIVGAFILAESIGPARITASAINLGSGFVEFSHGCFPVPAPACAEIAQGMQTFATESGMELATPTGLAILKQMSSAYTSLPTGSIDAVGYGAGARSTDQNPNFVRAYIVSTQEANDAAEEIHANIDDCSPELLSYAVERLLEAGALDAYTTPVQMKKGRSAYQLTVLCDPKHTDTMSRIIFEETSTTGLRIVQTRRKKLESSTVQVSCRGHSVRVKVASLEGRVVTVSPEYADCKAVAEAERVPLKQVYEEARHAALTSGSS